MLPYIYGVPPHLGLARHRAHCHCHRPTPLTPPSFRDGLALVVHQVVAHMILAEVLYNVSGWSYHTLQSKRKAVELGWEVVGCL